MPSDVIVVSIHEGDPLSRAGLVRFLENESGIVVSGPAENQPERAGDVAVTLADLGDLEAMTRLRKLIIEMDQRVVLVADGLEEGQLDEVLDLGLPSVVWRGDLSSARIADAVRMVARGAANTPPDLLPKLWAQLRDTRASSPSVDLSAREIAVLRLIAEGLDTKEIANELSYSEATVKSLLHHLMARRNFHNRVQGLTPRPGS